MSLNKTFFVLFVGTLLVLSFNNCSIKTDFLSTGTNSASDQLSSQPTGDSASDTLVEIQKSEPGLIIHRPLCLPTVFADYQSYCLVRGTSKIATSVRDINYLPSCEIVVNGKSSIFHLNGPQYIGQEANGGAVKLYYAGLMTESEYNATTLPCDLAIQRAALRQDQDKRRAEELDWGKKIAAEFASTIREHRTDRVLAQKIVGQFVKNHYSTEVMNTVHCVWMKDQNAGGCGNSNIPRWKNPPVEAVEAAADTDYAHYGEKLTLDRDLNDQDYFNLCGQCGH